MQACKSVLTLHVANRGDRREEIFRDDPDRQRFLSTFTEACGKTEWQIHADCLMSNEFKPVGRGWCLGSDEFRRRADTLGI